MAVELDGKRTTAAENPLFTDGLRLKDLAYTRRSGAVFVGEIVDKGEYKIVGRDKGVFKIDLTFTRAAAVGESNKTTTSDHEEKELWELVGKDKLRVCRGKGKDRPAAVTTAEGDGRVVYEYERKEP